MKCLACEVQTAELGLLCEDCQEAIACPYGLIPGQIVATPLRPTAAVLIDAWGRPHRLDANSVIGRGGGRAGVLVLHGTVSRTHAELSFDERVVTWTLSNLGASAQTIAEDEPVVGNVTLGSHARLQFGQVGFYFVADAASLPDVELDPSFNATVPTTDGQTAPGYLSMDGDDIGTSVGLPVVRIRLAEPTGGGVGVVDIAGHRITLPTIQFELISVLVKRMLDDDQQRELVRGYVRSTELLDSLSWDTSRPTHDNLKHLVRRVRRMFTRAGIGDLIEARYSFGYRLRVMPTGQG
jgi:hypothetical protein